MIGNELWVQARVLKTTRHHMLRLNDPINVGDLATVRELCDEANEGPLPGQVGTVMEVPRDGGDETCKVVVGDEAWYVGCRGMAWCVVFVVGVAVLLLGGVVMLMRPMRSSLLVHRLSTATAVRGCAHTHICSHTHTRSLSHTHTHSLTPVRPYTLTHLHTLSCCMASSGGTNVTRSFDVNRLRCRGRPPWTSKWWILPPSRMKVGKTAMPSNRNDVQK